MLVQMFYQKLHLLAPAIADKFLIEKYMNKLIWHNLWMMFYGLGRLKTKLGGSENQTKDSEEEGTYRTDSVL